MGIRLWCPSIEGRLWGGGENNALSLPRPRQYLHSHTKARSLLWVSYGIPSLLHRRCGLSISWTEFVPSESSVHLPDSIENAKTLASLRISSLYRLLRCEAWNCWRLPEKFQANQLPEVARMKPEKSEIPPVDPIGGSDGFSEWLQYHLHRKRPN